MLVTKGDVMNRSKGSLTVEASIALTAFMFLVVTVLSFSRVYRAQNLISHATLQTGQSLAIESYYRETVSGGDTAESFSKLIKLAGFFGWDTPGSWDDGYASLGDSGTNLHGIVKETFVYAIADTEGEANKILKSLGITEGMAGLDFSESKVSDKDIIITVKYKVKLPFSFFGERTLTLTKTVKCKAFK